MINTKEILNSHQAYLDCKLSFKDCLSLDKIEEFIEDSWVFGVNSSNCSEYAKLTQTLVELNISWLDKKELYENIHVFSPKIILTTFALPKNFLPRYGEPLFLAIEYYYVLLSNAREIFSVEMKDSEAKSEYLDQIDQSLNILYSQDIEEVVYTVYYLQTLLDDLLSYYCREIRMDLIKNNESERLKIVSFFQEIIESNASSC